MATWNTDAADFILRADQAEYNKRRQDVLDKRAAQDYALKRKDDLRKDELAEIDHAYKMRNIETAQKLADFERQKKMNDYVAAQQKHDYDTALHNDRMLNLGEQLQINALKRQKELNDFADAERARKEKLAALDRANVQREYSGRSLSPYAETLLKFRASGGDENALTDKEKNILFERDGVSLDSGDIPEYFDQLRNLTDKELNAEGLDPQFIPEYARQMRADAAKKAEYNRKNAPAIAKQARDEQYKTVSGFMTGLFNSAVAKGTIDPEKAKSKEIIEAATNIYNNAKNSGQDITPQQAFNMAAGIKDKLPTISEQAEKLYGAQYNDLDDADKKKLELMLTKFSAAKNSFDKKNYPKGSAEELKELRELEEYWRQMANAAGFGNWFDTYSDVKSPIFERLQHADYAAVHDEMLAREKALEEKYPRYFAWAKNNPGVSIRNYENYLVSPDEYTYIAAGSDTQRTPPKYYLDFKNEMLKIQELRDHLRELEGRIENNKNRFVD